LYVEQNMEKDQPAGRNFTVNVSSPGQCKRVLALELPEEELSRERERITRELRRELRVPGFRQGKVPLEYVQKNYADVIASDAVRNLLSEVYDQAMVQEGLHPLGDPRFENMKSEPGEGVQVEAHIEVRPEMEIKGYDSVRVSVERKDVGDDQVNETLENLRERYVSFEPADRAVTTSDLVTVDYAPYQDSGELDESQRQKNYPIEMSSDHLLEEFRVGLVGMKAGDDRDIDVSYPEDFPDKNLAGQKRKFKVNVVEVKEKLLPELDDALAKRVGPNFETLDALREQVLADLTREEEKRYAQELQEKAIDQLIEGNSFEVPDVMVNNYLASLVEEDRRRRPTVEDESKRESEIRELFSDAAVRSIRKFFILDAIRSQENIEVTDVEVSQKVDSLVASTGRPKEEIDEYLRNPDHRRNFMGELVDEKVLSFLRERVIAA